MQRNARWLTVLLSNTRLLNIASATANLFKLHHPSSILSSASVAAASKSSMPLRVAKSWTIASSNRYQWCRRTFSLKLVCFQFIIFLYCFKHFRQTWSNPWPNQNPASVQSWLGGKHGQTHGQTKTLLGSNVGWHITFNRGKVGPNINYQSKVEGIGAVEAGQPRNQKLKLSSCPPVA